ncbi:hypothetical protein BGZ97_003369 [Linnemannia gamsii]|uniref:Uncharacterized protein n=1 Tax=Linnemannia gamsii TaxID=64522 RepID=A0A9P6UGL2_9FUNG|nr:hypothetical protein BGZ97_003369 [Linnemannia gamsii]
MEFAKVTYPVQILVLAREIVEDLYQRRGYTIYATCLKFRPTSSHIVDVTNQNDISLPRALVEADCPRVYRVFNNAGLGAML